MRRMLTIGLLTACATVMWAQEERTGTDTTDPGNPTFVPTVKVSKVLLAYRDRNDVEVSFDDVKNAEDMRRMRNHNEKTIKGKMFVVFIALILLTKLRMEVQKVAPKERHYWSERDFLEKVDTYTRIHFENKYKDIYTVPTSAQQNQAGRFF